MSLQTDISLKVQVAARDSKIQELEAEVARLKQENTKYIKGSTANDNVISQTFASLQLGIKQLVQKWFQVDDYPRRIENFTGRDAKIFHGWHSSLGKKNQMNRVRGIIFNLLFHDMFKNPQFGFRNSKPDLESALAMFEGLILKYVMTHAEHIPYYTSWKIQTANWSQWLQTNENFTPEKCPKGAARIWCIMNLFLNPIEDQDQVEKRRREVLEDILQVYSISFKISLALRLLQDSYRVIMPGDVLKESDLDMVQVRGSERLDSSMALPSPIAFTLSGTLVRYSGQDGTEIAILSKANVIIGD